MTKKIVIVGCLGYLGTELSKIYSGESWTNKIIGLDNRFISERVSQLKDWNIEFFQGQILDKEFLKKHLCDADVVYHLAGVTDVAYVKTEANSILDKKIRTVAIDGTNNILNSIPKKCKLIFPSTHVVFEGLTNQKKNLTENNKTKPLLMYAKSKVQNEIDIKKSGINFVILRLGSVYGYSHDTMRINIMPNLFSKISSQNGSIKLFSGGAQLKSLVSLIDVVRCMKFVEEREDIKKEIFHLVNEQKTVKEVAQICKKINPEIKIEITESAIPNLGYTLSNKKLLRTGFKFLYNLENSILEMIQKWKYVKNKNNLEQIFKGQNEYIDKRGKILNFELSEPINLIGYIDSKKGTVRANHFHPIQEQKCLLIRGQFISIYKDLINKGSEIITHVVNEGDLIVTKPNVAHAMIFTKDSVFLNLVRGEREHKNYGITHTKPYILIDNNLKKKLLKVYKFFCRCCNSDKLKRVISLGFQPLANNLINNPRQKIEKYPLELNYCENCHNVQLSIAVESKKIFNNYYYLSSTSKSFREHFEIAAKKYFKEFKLKKNSYIIDVGSNDGIGLFPFKSLGVKNLLGIEPAKNLCKISRKKGINTINSYLDNSILKKIKKKADLILASNVFAHSDDLETMGKTILKLLKNNGVVIIEVQYLLRTLKDFTFDNIYHEHYNYWSLTTLKFFFKKLGGNIFKVEEIETHGGSLRVYISKNHKIKTHKSVKKLIKKEMKFGINKFSTYEKFSNKIMDIKKNVKKNILSLKRNSKNLIGYGAPAKATTALNFYGITKELEFIVEDNKLKHNKIIPGVNIPIFSKNKIINRKDVVVLVLAWNFFDEIKKNNYLIAKKFISIKDLEKNYFK